MKPRLVLFLYFFFFIFVLVLSQNERRQNYPRHLVEHGDLIFEKNQKEIYSGYSPTSEHVTSVLENVAQINKLQSIDSVFIPVRVNLIFVGFDGDGHNGLKLERENFQPWFRHIDHELSHIIAPIGNHQTTTHAFATKKTNVKYKVISNVVKISPLVNTIIEDEILWNLRLERHDYAEKNHYVDVFRISTVLSNLLEYLNMTDSYTLFILNPKRPIDESESYGYRTGFSSEDIRILRNSKSRLQSYPEFGPHDDRPTLKLNRSTLSSNPKLNRGNLIADSELWANWYIKNYIANKTTDIDEEEDTDDEDDPHNLHQRLEVESDPHSVESVLEFAHEISKRGTRAEKRYLQKVLNEEIVEANCLVDGWISHERFAFIDLSAGPFQWGPTLTGAGIKTLNSLPRVPEPIEVDDLSLPTTAEKTTLEIIEYQYAELFRIRDMKCNGQSSPFCRSLDSRIRALALKIEESDESFSMMDLLKTKDISAESHRTFVELNRFLSKLGALVSHSFRHLFLPAVPLFATPYTERVTFHLVVVTQHNAYDPLESNSFDHLEFKRELLKFKLPSQEFVFATTKVSMDEDPSIVAAYSASIRTASLFTTSATGAIVNVQQHYLDSMQLESLLHPSHDKKLDFGLDDKDDSSHEGHSTSGVGHNWRHSRHIPIFLFSLNTSYPVLIDKYYQAKALSEAVVVVQNNIERWESRISCNGEPIIWNLKKPLKRALASTILALGGLIPTHISYDEASQRAIQNWFWSIGDNPLSSTSSGHHFSAIHKDIVFRNYVASSLDASIETINEAVELLSHQQLPQVMTKLPDLPIILTNISRQYNRTKHLWQKIAESTGGLRFDKAVSELKRLEESTSRLKGMAVDVKTMLGKFECENKRVEFSLIEYLFPLFLILDVLICITVYVVRPHKSKIKIN